MRIKQIPEGDLHRPPLRGSDHARVFSVKPLDGGLKERRFVRCQNSCLNPRLLRQQLGTFPFAKPGAPAFGQIWSAAQPARARAIRLLVSKSKLNPGNRKSTSIIAHPSRVAPAAVLRHLGEAPVVTSHQPEKRRGRAGPEKMGS